MTISTIIPEVWLAVANERRPKLSQTTEWFSGLIAPVRVGWYERHFTDSMVASDNGSMNASMHYWDGKFWSHKDGGISHWRQVGDYPAWRGLSSEQPN